MGVLFAIFRPIGFAHREVPYTCLLRRKNLYPLCPFGLLLCPVFQELAHCSAINYSSEIYCFIAHAWPTPNTGFRQSPESSSARVQQSRLLDQKSVTDTLTIGYLLQYSRILFTNSIGVRLSAFLFRY